MNLLQIRDSFWTYPYSLFVGRRSIWGRVKEFYVSTRPFSYIITTFLIFIVISSMTLAQLPIVLGFNQNTFIEGVVTGISPSGNANGPAKLNPLQLSVSQLDKDIMELVYEPLIKVNQNGEVEPILAEKFTIDSSNKNERVYRFSLRRGVTWHDGTPFTTQDVAATFELIKELGSSGVPDIYASEASKNIRLEVLDDYVCRFIVENQTIPNFYELMAFKIVPSNRIEQYRNAILTGQYLGGNITLNGTGPYQLEGITEGEVRMVANKNYYLAAPKITKFIFKLLRNETEGLDAFRSGQLHAITNISNNSYQQLALIPNVGVIDSNIIYTQYYGIYFNLTETGRNEFKNAHVRKAFSEAIDRDLLVEKVLTHAEPAYGTIPPNSPYFDKEEQQPGYNKTDALALLKEENWTLENPDDTDHRLQTKSDQKLQFTLSYADNSDRTRLAEQIKANLQQIGIQIQLDPKSPTALMESRLRKDFELILLGVSTFVDPDRYEFFASGQLDVTNNDQAATDTTGLNISGYKSGKLVTDIDKQNKGKIIKIPLADKLLDQARKLSDTNITERKKLYSEFQSVLAEDIPVIFLYYPSMQYAVSKRVKNITLENISNSEERFDKAFTWEISYN